jgi:mono/diheme cytochrome c family protein
MLDYTAITQVPRDKIVSMEDSATSMMPPGMINNLTEDQIADLSAYILSLNDPKGPMFKQ